MNKVIRIHLAKVAYDIEDQAAAQLGEYMKSLSAVLATDTQRETMADIEARMTEILSSRSVEPGSVISTDDVQAIKQQLGGPEAFAENQDPATTPPKRGMWLLWTLAGAGVLVIALAGIWLLRPLKTAETQTQAYQQNISQLELSITSGNVEIMPSNDNTVTLERRLEWDRDKPTFKEEWSGETLRVSTQCPPTGFMNLIFGGSHCELDYIIRVPRSIALDSRIEAGNLLVRDIEGAIHSKTVAGDVTVANARGNLVIEVNAGTINGAELFSQEVSAITDSGNIALRFNAPAAKVAARVASGNIDVMVPRDDAYKVDASTQAGERNVTVQQDSSAPRTITAQTSAGNVSVGYQ